MNLYSLPKHFIAVDCAIFGYKDGELKILLYPSSYEPYVGEWSLVGGFLKEDETIPQAAQRILLDRLGVNELYMREVGTFSALKRDAVARVVSVMHYALVRQEDINEEGLKELGAQWFPIDELPKLMLDYDNMIDVAFKKLRKQANSQLLGKELLPKKFTMRQLRQVYECIFLQHFEPANFRKKIMSLKVLIKHNEKCKNDSKKGAYFYSFNPMAEDRSLDRIVKLH